MALYVGKPTDLVAHGPVIAVKLWVPKQVVSTLVPIDTLAVIDTALATTCIQEGVATSLGLQPSGMVTITTATTVMYKTHLFRIRVAFPEGNMSFEVQAAEVPYMLQPYARLKCRIGRDILQFGILNYDGPTNTFSLKF